MSQSFCDNVVAVIDMITGLQNNFENIGPWCITQNYPESFAHIALVTSSPNGFFDIIKWTPTKIFTFLPLFFQEFSLHILLWGEKKTQQALQRPLVKWSIRNELYKIGPDV